MTIGRVGGSAAVETAALPDTPTTGPFESAPPPAGWSPAPVRALSSRSVVFATPAGAAVLAVRMRDSTGVGPTVLLNAPTAWFAVGDLGGAASPGGTLRVAGTALSVSGHTPAAVLAQGATVVAALSPSASSPASPYYAIWDVPATVPPGDYQLWLHNGAGGPLAWRAVEQFDTVAISTVTIATRPAWPTTVVELASQSGATADDKFGAAIAALAANHGGVLHVPAGVYHLTQQLMLPDHTLLRGDGAGSTQLLWDSSPTKEYDGGRGQWVDTGHDVPLVRGSFVTWGSLPRTAFSIEDLALVAPPSFGASGNVNAQAINRSFNREPVWLRRISVTVAPLPATATSIPPASALFLRQADNTEVSDSALSANYPIFARDGVRQTMVRNNTLAWSQGIWTSACSRANVFEGNTIAQLGDSTSNGWGLLPNPNPGITFSAFYASADCRPYAKDTLFFGNQTTRATSELPPGYVGYTSDGGSGVYLGRVASVAGTHLTLAAASTGTSEYAGGLVLVLDGSGAGQVRHVTSMLPGASGLDIDRPFDVPLDGTSVVSIVNDHGRLLLIGNDLTQFPLLQDYFLAADSLFAGNTLGLAGAPTLVTHWAGLHYSGTLPAWHTQVLDNTFIAGTTNSYSSSLPSPTSGYGGALAAGHVYRGAAVSSGAGPTTLLLRPKSDTLADTLVARNTFDRIDFAPNGQPYTLAGAVVLEANQTPAGAATPINPSAPSGATIVP